MHYLRGFPTAILCAFLQMAAGSSPGRAQSAAAITADLPDFSGQYSQIEGADAISQGMRLADLLRSFVPMQVSSSFDLLGKAGRCVQDQGLLGWRLYVQKADQYAFGVVAFVSKRQIRNINVLIECGKQVFMGGGPGSQFSPCADRGDYQGSNDTYFYFYGASKQSVCSDFSRALGMGGSRPSGPPETSSSPPSSSAGGITMSPTQPYPAIAECRASLGYLATGQQVLVNVIMVTPPTVRDASQQVITATYTPYLYSIGRNRTVGADGMERPAAGRSHCLQPAPERGLLGLPPAVMA
jgi:hypothetical protein